MTYDVAVWRHQGPPLADDKATAEFERRCELSDNKPQAGELDPISPELKTLFDQLRARFPDEPWENDDSDADGDFIYFAMAYGDGPWVEAAMVELAPSLGLVVYSPLSLDPPTDLRASA